MSYAKTSAVINYVTDALAAQYNSLMSEVRAAMEGIPIDDRDFNIVWNGNEIASVTFEDDTPSGSVTRANIRLSAVDGTAFVDFSSAIKLVPYLNWKLTITDSAGKTIVGWIKAAGTGETYGSELVTNGTMELDSNWNNVSTPVVNERSTEQVHGGTYSRKFTADSYGDGIKCDAWSVTAGALYKLVAWYYPLTHVNYFRYYIRSGNNGSTLRSVQGVGSIAAWNDGTIYAVETNTGASGYVAFDQPLGSTTRTYYIDDVSYKQVLTPSATGVTIVSTQGGSTYNWTSQEAGFNYNDASGYTYSLSDGDVSFGVTGATGFSYNDGKPTQVVTAFDPAEIGKIMTEDLTYTGDVVTAIARTLSTSASGSCTKANMRLSAVNGTAFVDFSAGIKLVPYRNWKLTITDSAGKTIVGWIKAAGTGETYSEKIINGDFASAEPPGTAWSREGDWVVSGGIAYTTAQANRYIYQTNLFSQFASVLWSLDILLNTGTMTYQVQNTNVLSGIGTGEGTKSGYHTVANATGITGVLNNQLATQIDNAIAKQVLTPAVTGVTIVSTQGGSTYNWASQEAGFNYNDSSGYTYIISLT